MNARPEFLASPQPADAPRDAATAAVACADLLARLRAALAAPDASTLPLCERATALLAELPFAWSGTLGIECLFAVAQIHYVAARAPAARAPMSAAVERARERGDPTLLRKALTFLGVVEMENGNLPAATACFSEALDVARLLSDPAEAAPVWNNLGLALQRSALNAEAVQCYQRAVALAEGSRTVAMVHRSALTNIANCAVHLEDLRIGVRAAHEAIALNPAPADATDRLSRATAEANLVRLLLELGDVDAAAVHAAQCRQHADQVPGGRGELVVALTDGLVAVHRGQPDLGLPLLKRALELTRQQVPAEVRDTLSICVEGYRRAGQSDVALIYLHELLAMNRRARAEQVILQHREHVARLEGGQPLPRVAAPERAMRRQRGKLRGELGDRQLVRNRMLLLEQQSVAAELHDDTTGEHCYRVGRLASLLAREAGLEEEVCFLIDLAARLHDIGKLVVPDAILLKPGALTLDERAIMQTHTTAGAEILARSQVPQMHVAEEIARHHHERWDGRGYPARLARSAIPIAARVAALADVFDALTHVRSYKTAWPVPQALEEIRRLRGQQFDPELTDLFLDLVPRLQREVGDLDAHLAVEARHSPFVAARRQIAAALKGDDPSRSLFELRR